MSNDHVVNVEVKSVNFPAFGAYVSPTARERDAAQVIMNFALCYAAAKKSGADPAEIMSSVLVHELLHVFQDLFGKALTEADVEKLMAEAEGEELTTEPPEYGTRCGVYDGTEETKPEGGAMVIVYYYGKGIPVLKHPREMSWQIGDAWFEIPGPPDREIGPCHK